MNKGLLFVCLMALLGLCSCYQMDADSDLRTVPVTNNPNVIPASDPMSRFTAIR